MKFFQEDTPRSFVFSLLIIFFIKGSFLAILFPFLQQPDEQIHYATIQHWAEPKEKTWKTSEEKAHLAVDSNDISTYRLTEELIETAKRTDFDDIHFEKENTTSFAMESQWGPSEQEILENSWKRHADFEVNNFSETNSIYYFFASKIEKLFSNLSIFLRFYIMRILSVIFGIGVITIAYFTAKKSGFSQSSSLLLTTIIAFQPMFSVTAAQVNIDIALIFSFSVFIYAAVCILQDGLSWKNGMLAVIGATLGITAKGPGIILIALLFPLIAFGFWRKSVLPLRTFLPRIALATATAGIVLWFFVPKHYLASIFNSTNESRFSSPIESIREYLDKTIRMSEFHDTEVSYWGNFGWLDTPVPNWTISTIVLVEIISYGSIFFFLFRKKPFPDFLPSKTIILAALIIIFTLQGAIRFYDWRIFDTIGQILIGQPGRYFLPTILPTILVITTGIGLLLRKREHFHFALQALALLMILFQLSAIINTIIPRYHL